ncbi:MAG: glycerol-3-phosphate dehydrogenase/oxidase, partial [Acidimicrobiales bacterium]
MNEHCDTGDSSAGSLTPTSREALLDELEGSRFDVVVVGGGITGAGVARDAAARGLRVALVEAHDFAAGTSSRSSKLIHGGLRYLAMGEIGMVRETALERKAVHAMAPHLAEPCWMVVPTRNTAAMLKFRAAIGTYEKLGAVEDIDRHRVWAGDELSRMEPLLRRDVYKYGVAYREYMTDDARLVLAVLRSAVGDKATVANFTRVVGLLREGERVVGVTSRCSLTDREVEVRGDVVVNAAGPWVTELARMEADPPRTRLHLSRGIHVVLDRERFPVNHLVIFGTRDKRSTFAIPRGHTVAIGTTDTSYLGQKPLWPEIEAGDVEYLLEPLTRYFELEPLGPGDIIAAWSGVRPLVDRPGKEPKELSRRDEVSTGPGGMISVSGGKLTGFRRMAANIVDDIEERLGRTLRDAPGPTPLPGGDTDRDLSATAG